MVMSTLTPADPVADEALQAMLADPLRLRAEFEAIIAGIATEPTVTRLPTVPGRRTRGTVPPRPTGRPPARSEADGPPAGCSRPSGPSQAGRQRSPPERPGPGRPRRIGCHRPHTSTDRHTVRQTCRTNAGAALRARPVGEGDVGGTDVRQHVGSSAWSVSTVAGGWCHLCRYSSHSGLPGARVRRGPGCRVRVCRPSGAGLVPSPG